MLPWSENISPDYFKGLYPSVSSFIINFSAFHDREGLGVGRRGGGVGKNLLGFRCYGLWSFCNFFLFTLIIFLNNIVSDFINI